MANMTINTTFHTLRTRRAGRGAAVALVAALAISGAACSSSDGAASPEATTAATAAATSATTSVAPATSASTATSAPPTTAAPSTTSPADPERRALLSGILESHHAAGEFVGGRIALRDRDGTITEATAGTQTIEPGSPPVDLDVPWNIGSVTKTFVAVVVLQLADEGAIDLDAGIEGFMPGLAGADRITPRQLLQHTSGLNEYNQQPAVLADAQREWTPAELIAVAEAAGRVAEPGAGFHYSNTNYIVLGEIIEQVTGHSWADEVHKRITGPLGMSSTDVIRDDWSPGYTPVDGGFVDTTTSQHPSLGGPAGGLQSNGRDLLRFVTALAEGTLLSADSQAAMRAFVPGYDYSELGITHVYGLGLEQYSTDAVTVTGHLGTGVQSAFIGYDAKHGTAVAVMINTANPESQGLMALETLTAVLAAPR